MANWRLEPLRDRLSEVAAPVLLVHGSRDAAIPEKTVLEAAALIRGCQTRRVELGHLAHEEAPGEAAAIIAEFARAAQQA
jgi:magnesium chelatase accessory protein